MTWIGIGVVIASVLGGFMMAGGHVGVLVQPSEFVVILGAAIGTFMTSAPGRMRSRVRASMRSTVAAGIPTRQDYLQLLKLMYELFLLARRQGVLALEPHASEPDRSALFQRYRVISKVPHAKLFLSEGLMMLVNSVDPDDFDALLDTEIESLRSEADLATGLVKTIGEALPGLGIVAAVLGIVVTMGYMDQPPAVIGHHVAAALVGTFLGILLCYGILAPLATNAEFQTLHQRRFLHVIKFALVASARGVSPPNAIEFGRHVIFTDERPTFNQVDLAISSLTGAASAPGDVQPGEMQMF